MLRFLDPPNRPEAPHAFGQLRVVLRASTHLIYLKNFFHLPPHAARGSTVEESVKENQKHEKPSMEQGQMKEVLKVDEMGACP